MKSSHKTIAVFVLGLLLGVALMLALRTGGSQVTTQAAVSASGAVSRSSSAITSVPSTKAPTTTYILNTSTKVFHKPTCSSVSQMSEKNKSTFTGSRQTIIDRGYRPCGRCNP